MHKKASTVFHRLVVISILFSFCLTACNTNKDESIPVVPTEVASSLSTSLPTESERVNEADEIDNLDMISKQDALNDLLFLAKTLEESYPYVNTAERLFSLDYSKHKEHYEKIYRDDDELITMYDHYRRLSNFISFFGRLEHLVLLDASEYTLMYKFASKRNDDFLNKHLKVLDNPKSIKFYESLGAVRDIDYEDDKVNEVTFSTLEPQILDDKTAYVKINSFSQDNVNADKSVMFDFYENISDVENLIIDITDNFGGSTLYWREVIVWPNITYEVRYKEPFFLFRNSHLNEEYMKDIKEVKDIKELKLDLFPLINYGDIKKLDRFLQIEKIFQPKSEKKMFDGNIFVLISGNVYSAASDFAYFCKQTGFATLVGSNTRGGNGLVPIYASLPSSGIIVEFSNVYSINDEGECLEEVGVSPDFYIGESANALSKCLDVIEEQSKNKN